MTTMPCGVRSLESVGRNALLRGRLVEGFVCGRPGGMGYSYGRCMPCEARGKRRGLREGSWKHGEDEGGQ